MIPPARAFSTSMFLDILLFHRVMTAVFSNIDLLGTFWQRGNDLVAPAADHT